MFAMPVDDNGRAHHRWTLVRDVEEPAIEERTLGYTEDGTEIRGLVYPHMKLAEVQPSPRPGQRRSDCRYEYAILDRERTDPGDLGRYLMRRDDGLRVAAGHHDVCGFAYVSGPTEPETPREALERVVKLEAEYPAAGETRGTWLRWLLGAIEAAQVRTANLCGRSAVDACSVRGWARGRRREFVANDELSLGPWHGAVAWEAGR